MAGPDRRGQNQDEWRHDVGPWRRAAGAGRNTPCERRGTKGKRGRGGKKATPAWAPRRDRPVAGPPPPQVNEAIIRDVWPSVAAYPTAANFARAAYRSIILAPLGWL